MKLFVVVFWGTYLQSVSEVHGLRCKTNLNRCDLYVTLGRFKLTITYFYVASNCNFEGKILIPGSPSNYLYIKFAKLRLLCKKAGVQYGLTETL